MKPLTLLSPLQQKMRPRVPLSPRQLEQSLQSHFVFGFIAAAGVVSSIFNFGMDLEKGHAGIWSFLSVPLSCLLAWALWDKAREDLRQMAHFKLEHLDSIGTDSPVEP